MKMVTVLVIVEGCGTTEVGAAKSDTWAVTWAERDHRKKLLFMKLAMLASVMGVLVGSSRWVPSG